MSRRLTILAGSGALVPEVIDGARSAGDSVQVLPLVDRSDLGFAEKFGATDLPKLMWRISSFRSTHVTMVGGLRASNADREAFRRFAGAKGRSGDASLLKVAETLLSITGAKLVGAEAIVPEIVAAEGLIAGPAADASMLALARFGLQTARAIGALDIGQAAIVAAGRVIAVEDVAGTDALLERVAGYRAAGFDADGQLLLAKSLKPQQSKLVDRPAIGPDTVRNAAKAGIAAVAVEAGAAILIGRAEMRALATQHGVTVLGVDLSHG